MISIKAKVTLWYTFSMIIITSIVVVFIISFSQRISQKQLREKIIDIVTNTLQEVELNYGELEKDVDLYNNGVSIFIYDTNGYLIAPRVNQGIQIDSLLEDQTIKIVDSIGEKWMVYDLFAEKNNTNFWIRGIISISATKQTISDISLIAIAILPIFIFITAFGGFKITQKAFIPIKNIANTAYAINSGNDLSSRIIIKNSNTNDELSDLVKIMNEMFSRLQTSFNNEKQFTSDVSHELRTPISVIISQCEYLLSKDLSLEERNKSVNVILKKAQIMSDIISQLLLLVRTENGNFKPHIENNNISLLCDMILLDLENIAKEYGIKLEREIEEDIFIMCDEVLIARMLTNIVMNAIKYNKNNGSVNLCLNRDKNSVIIIVSDTGIGIEKDKINSIWNRFYRIDTSRSGEGIGLGLAMVKWIIDIHNGSVEVESIFNVGSKFTIKLPLN